MPKSMSYNDEQWNYPSTIHYLVTNEKEMKTLYGPGYELVITSGNELDILARMRMALGILKILNNFPKVWGRVIIGSQLMLQYKNIFNLSFTNQNLIKERRLPLMFLTLDKATSKR